MNPSRPGRVASIGATLVSVFLLLPLLAVIPVSFTPERYLSLPDTEWSWRHYQTLMDDPKWLGAAWLSACIGLASAALATALGLMFSLGIWMQQPRFTGLLMGLVLLPMVAPPVVSALTLYFFLVSLGQVSGLIGCDTVLGVVLAHAVMIAPFAVVLITVALAHVDRRIDLAARAMGAGLWARIVRVILPNIRFAVLMAFFLTFVLSWEEIGVTVFITSVNVATLPRLMWMGLRDNIDPAIAAVSVVLIAFVATIIIGRSICQAVASNRISSENSA
jgi:putative spermidine/putrescine transport system permease protein